MKLYHLFKVIKSYLSSQILQLLQVGLHTKAWVRTSLYKHSFFPDALTLWNKLPEDMTNTVQITSNLTLART